MGKERRMGGVCVMRDRGHVARLMYGSAVFDDQSDLGSEKAYEVISEGLSGQ